MNQEYARVARTAACPCGSGRRYKDCHGSIRGAPDAAVQPAGLDSLLREALAAQQAGRFAEASAKYEAALALQPAHFDALHMLGVVCLQLDQLERAEALVRSALSLRVTPAAEYNLNLIQEAQRIRAGESRLSRSVLPALERLLVPPANAQRFLSRARSTAHLVVAESGSAELVDRIVAAFRNHARIRVWRSGSAEPAVRHAVEAEAFGSEVVADSDVIIVVGTGVPLGTWTFDSPATARVLVVTRDAPGDVLDRIREFSAQGRQPVLACFADPPVQQALSLRGIVIDDLPALAQRSLDGSLPTTSPLAVAERPVVAFSGPRPVRTIAFYLPQFHPIRENDEWWGPGFTEWTNVRRGEPQFLGHYQPHEPAAPLGYYDLRDPAVRAAQAELARAHGIDGFCYYFYWFNGKRLLERPLDDMLASGVPDFPFCICWANENWTRRWDGLEQEVLLAQQYGMDDAIALVRSWIATVLRDRRYIRVDGRPLVLVYKAQLIPDLAAVAATWRRLAREELGTDLYLCACETGDPVDPRAFGFDAAVEFPPHRHRVISLNARLSNRRPTFAGTVTSYRSQVVQSIERPLPSYPLHRTVMPAWDNTARRQSSGLIFSGSSPELFGEWARSLAAQVSERRRGDERLLFVNAWNEWGEGCHLEPDMRYGLQYLDALRDALAAAAQH